MERIQSLRSLIPRSTITYYRKPLLIERGRGQFLYNNEGKEFLDMFGGIVTVSVGHCHPFVKNAVVQQMDKLWHTTSIYLTEPIFEYAETLTATLPSHLNVCLFTNSGSEANDLALELARLHTGRFDVLSLRNGYHGMTQALAGATNLGSWKQPLPHGFGILKSLCPDPHRGVFGGSKCRDSPSQSTLRQCSCIKDQCSAADNYIKQLAETLDYDFPKSTGPAAFIAESIQGVGGTIQYPKGYLKRAFELIRSRGGLCISDEVQTGFGRLGCHFWGFESQDAVPDIVTMAKGMANGFPMGAVVTTQDIAESFGKALYFNTFGGNPLASTAANATLKVIKEEKLQQNSRIVGTYLMEELLKLKSPWIGDIRGKGLMIGVELINEKGEPLETNRMADFFEETKDRGLLIGKGSLTGNVLRIKPPMCITKADADRCVETISKSLESVIN